ncbi:MAG: ORF6N domain-containing protein [Nanoarchaeota archaeon]
MQDIKIHTIRGKQVMLDSVLAELYEVEVKYLKRQVRRNRKRFPENFCFQLTEKEFEDWRCQNVTSNSVKMGLRYSPYAFTEQGVSMLSAVLKSEKAIETSIKIMNAFISMKRFLNENAEVFSRLDKRALQILERV